MFLTRQSLAALCCFVFISKSVLGACPDGCLCPETYQVFCRNISTANWPTFDENIKELDVSTNRITNLKADTLSKLTKLKTLSLDYNRLSELPDNFLSSVKLEIFSVSNNKLKNLEFLRGQNQLKQLDLSFNNLEELPKDIFTNFNELIMLNLEGNKLKNPWSALQGLPLLSKLSLDGNPLIELSSKTLETLPKLKFLYVANCSLTEVDLSKDLPIFNLDLSGNPLKNLKSNAFSGLEYSFEINLKNVGLKSLPEGGFQGLNWLRRLSLADNPIGGSLTNTQFKGLPKLEALNLQSTNLKNLPEGLFSELPKLGNLTLASNGITILREGVLSHVSKLYTLDLSDNRLTSFTHKALAPNVKLTRLVLSGNPLKCNCEMHEAAEWAKLRELDSEGECAVPDSLAGQTWINAVSNLNCLSESKIEDLA